MATAGMQWIRVDVNARRHPKVRRLCVMLKDPNAFAYVVALWSFTGEWYPDGFLPVTAELLEEELGWTVRGPSGALIAGLVSSDLLSVVDGGYQTHGWDDTNGPIYTKMTEDRGRKQAARNANKPSKAATSERTESPVVHRHSQERPQNVHGQSTDSLRSGAVGVEWSGVEKDLPPTPTGSVEPSSSEPASVVVGGGEVLSNQGQKPEAPQSGTLKAPENKASPRKAVDPGCPQPGSDAEKLFNAFRATHKPDAVCTIDRERKLLGWLRTHGIDRALAVVEGAQYHDQRLNYCGKDSKKRSRNVSLEKLFGDPRHTDASLDALRRFRASEQPQNPDARRDPTERPQPPVYVPPPEPESTPAARAENLKRIADMKKNLFAGANP